MPRPLRQTTLRDVMEINTAIAQLRGVRDRLVLAGATQAAKYVRRALKSAEGAHRHALRAQAQLEYKLE